MTKPTVDRTSQLHDLFQASVERRKSVSTTETRPQPNPTAYHFPGNDPFAEGFAAVNADAQNAMRQVWATIVSALKAMSHHGSVMDVEAALLVADAGISSASASTRAFLALMEKAKAEVSKNQRNRKREEGAQPSAAAGDEDAASIEDKSLELISHYLSASISLSALVDQRRLDLTICREELEVHKKELKASVSLWLCIDGSESGRSPPRLRRESGGATVAARTRTGGAGGSEKDILQQHLKTAAVTAAQTAERGRRVIEGATDRLTNTVTSTMLNFARKTTAVTRKVAVNGASGVFEEVAQSLNGTVNTADNGQKVNKNGASSPAYVYTEEERHELERQRDVMLMEERISNAASARDIEATINELSQLTSMMQTRVLEQDEQLEDLEKNANEATSNIEKATEELRQPLKSSWWSSATMQMVALLWAATAVILGSHFVIG